MTMQHWHVYGNMPGYMPDTDDPAIFGTFWEGLEGLADELERQGDDLYDRTGMFGDGPYDVEDIGGEAAALEEEGDRIHAIAAGIRRTLKRRDLSERTDGTYSGPSQVDLGPDDLWPVSMALNGIVVHVETDPTSGTHLGWNVHLDPCVEAECLSAADLRQCDECGAIEDAGTYPDQDGEGRSECCTTDR